MDPKQLPGALKAAILIKSVDKPTAEKLLARMGEQERQLIEDHINKIGNLSPELVEKVAREFTQLKASDQRQVTGRPVNNQPEEPGKEPADDDTVNNTGLKVLQSLDPEEIFDLIKEEHPQTIAIIAAHLNSRVAGGVLSCLPDEMQTDVSLRIAGLDRVQSGMIQEIDNIFEDILKKRKTSGVNKVGGVDSLADILNQTDGEAGRSILEGIAEKDPDLADSIKKKMFSFEDIVFVDDRGFQQVLRHIDRSGLSLALKAATDEVKDKVFRNMSGRASEMLREEIESLGAVRMSEVLIAQRDITTLIQEMEEKGELVIQGRGGEEFVA